jgi:hypothetical protein
MPDPYVAPLGETVDRRVAGADLAELLTPAPKGAPGAALINRVAEGLQANPAIPRPARYEAAVQSRAVAQKPPEDAVPELAKLFDLDADEKAAARTKYSLAKERSYYADKEPSLAEYAVLRSLPGASSVGTFGMELEYGKARKRIEDGAAQDGDAKTVARYERLQQLEAKQQETTEGATKSALAHIPAIMGEAIASGGIVNAGKAMLRARRIATLAKSGQRLESAGGIKGLLGLENIVAKDTGQTVAKAGLKDVALNAGGRVTRNVATTAAMPSMYLPQSAQAANENGGEWSDRKNIGPAFAIGNMQVAVLGTMGGLGRALPGNSIPTMLTRIPIATATGMTEQGAVDILAGITGLQKHYGVAPDLLKGWESGDEKELADAKKNAWVQAVTFAAFSTMHARKDEPSMRRKPADPAKPLDPDPAEAKKVTEELKKNMTSYDAVMKDMGREKGSEAIVGLTEAMQKVPEGATPEQVRAHQQAVVDALPDGALKDHAKFILDTLAKAEPPRPEPAPAPVATELAETQKPVEVSTTTVEPAESVAGPKRSPAEIDAELRAKGLLPDPRASGNPTPPEPARPKAEEFDALPAKERMRISALAGIPEQSFRRGVDSDPRLKGILNRVRDELSRRPAETPTEAAEPQKAPEPVVGPPKDEVAANAKTDVRTPDTLTEPTVFVDSRPEVRTSPELTPREAELAESERMRAKATELENRRRKRMGLKPLETEPAPFTAEATRRLGEVFKSAGLTPKQVADLMPHIDGAGFADIAAGRGASRQAVEQMILRAFDKLQTAFPDKAVDFAREADAALASRGRGILDRTKGVEKSGMTTVDDQGKGTLAKDKKEADAILKRLNAELESLIRENQNRETSDAEFIRRANRIHAEIDAVESGRKYDRRAAEGGEAPRPEPAPGPRQAAPEPKPTTSEQRLTPEQQAAFDRTQAAMAERAKRLGELAARDAEADARLEQVRKENAELEARKKQIEAEEAALDKQLADLKAKKAGEPTADYAGFPLKVTMLDGLFKLDNWKSFAKKWFAAGGLMPKDAFEAILRKDGRLNAYMDDIRANERDFRKAAGGYEKMTDAEIRLSNLALEGDPIAKASLSQMNPEVAKQVEKMRGDIDAFSNELIATGAARGKMVGVIDRDIGFYLNRAYRAFTDPAWAGKVDQQVKNRAVAWLDGEYRKLGQVLPNADLVAKVESLLVNNTAYENPIAFLAEAISSKRLGQKDLEIFTKRKDVPEPLRELWGEIKDPLANYANTVSKQARMLTNHAFQQEVLAAGLGKYFFEKETIDANGRHLHTLVDKHPGGESSMGDLAGKFMTLELKQAFEDYYAPQSMSSVGRAYMTAMALTKYAKTVASPVGHVKNMVGNVHFLVANGHYRVATIKDALEVFRKDDAVSRQKYREAVELGVIGDGIREGDFKQNVIDYLGGREEYQAARLGEITDRRIAGWVKKGLRWGAKLYRTEDAVPKYIAFLNETASYKKAYPNMPDAQVKQIAARNVRLTFPSHSMQNRAVTLARRNPFVGPFPGFTAETIRASVATLKLAVQEMKQPETRASGARRLVGFALAAAFTASIGAASRGLVNRTTEEDEAMRRNMPPWSENSVIMHFGDGKDGKPLYADIGSTDPNAYFAKVIHAALKGDAQGAAFEAGAPFAFTPEILTSKVGEAAFNTQLQSGQPVYNPQAPTEDKIEKVGRHVGEAFKPGLVDTVQRAQKSEHTERELAQLAGQRVQEIDVPKTLTFKSKGFVRERSDARNLIGTAIRSREPVTDDVLRAEYAKAEAANRRLFDELRKDVLAARVLKVSESDVFKILDQGGVSKDDARRVIRGDYQPYRPEVARDDPPEVRRRKEFVRSLAK